MERVEWRQSGFLCAPIPFTLSVPTARLSEDADSPHGADVSYSYLLLLGRTVVAPSLVWAVVQATEPSSPTKRASIPNPPHIELTNLK